MAEVTTQAWTARWDDARRAIWNAERAASGRWDGDTTERGGDAAGVTTMPVKKTPKKRSLQQTRSTRAHVKAATRGRVARAAAAAAEAARLTAEAAEAAEVAAQAVRDAAKATAAAEAHAEAVRLAAEDAAQAQTVAKARRWWQ